jgi:hypothetical protein
MLCEYCNKKVDLDELGNRIGAPFIINLPEYESVIFCSAICGNKYCIDKNIPFRFCIHPNCDKRGPYYKKQYFAIPHAYYCYDCFQKIKVTCAYCGRRYYSNRSKARKTNDPERFCSIKCEKLFHANEIHNKLTE